jgi:hypothetical protein
MPNEYTIRAQQPWSLIFLNPSKNGIQVFLIFQQPIY